MGLLHSFLIPLPLPVQCKGISDSPSFLLEVSTQRPLEPINLNKKMPSVVDPKHVDAGSERPWGFSVWFFSVKMMIYASLHGYAGLSIGQYGRGSSGKHSRILFQSKSVALTLKRVTVLYTLQDSLEKWL